MTLEKLSEHDLDLLDELARVMSSAKVIDNSVYSLRFDGMLEARLPARNDDALLVTGTETEVCVLAAVPGAVDFDNRVLLPADAVCVSSDDGGDA